MEIQKSLIFKGCSTLIFQSEIVFFFWPAATVSVASSRTPSLAEFSATHSTGQLSWTVRSSKRSTDVVTPRPVRASSSSAADPPEEADDEDEAAAAAPAPAARCADEAWAVRWEMCARPSRFTFRWQWRHTSTGAGSPRASHTSNAVLPSRNLWLRGFSVMVGASAVATQNSEVYNCSRPFTRQIWYNWRCWERGGGGRSTPGYHRIIPNTMLLQGKLYGVDGLGNRLAIHYLTVTASRYQDLQICFISFIFHISLQISFSYPSDILQISF